MPHSPRRPLVARAAALLAALGTATAALAAAPALLAAQPGIPTSVTFFGDSYTDTGNLLLGTGGVQPPSPPYAPGRFSNGPLWAEYFAAAIGRPGDAAPAFFPQTATGNYAVGAAATTGALPPGTDAQILRYLTRPGAAPGTVGDPSGLYALLVGGVDLRVAATLGDAAAREASAAAAAGRIVAQAGQLAGAGAGSVLLFTFPSVGSLFGGVAVADQVTGAFNAALLAGVGGLQGSAPATTFQVLRLDNLFANLLLDAAAGGERFGITNVAVPCLPPFAPPGAPSCDVSLFVDDIHLTTATHAIVAGAAYDLVVRGQNVAVIPEPATVVLLGAGLVALVGVRGVHRRLAGH